MARLRIQNKFYYVDTYHNKIEGILLFGSHVLGDADEKSDIDLLVVIDNCSLAKKDSIRYNIAQALNIPTHWIDIYTKDTFKERCKRGDYFFWAIKLHHIVLYSKSDFIDYYFSQMPLYYHIKSDIYESLNGVSKVISRFNQGQTSAEKALNYIAHVVRNCCIALCYMYGYLEFTKYSPAQRCFKIKEINMPFTLEEYINLYTLKREYKYRPNTFKLNFYSHDYINDWYYRYLKLVDEVLRIEKNKMTSSFQSPLKLYC